MTSRPAISALAPYFGGKRTLAPRIVAELGPHKAYAELCMGSLAVLLRKDPAGMEIANDLYGSMINLARVVASERHRELIRRAARLYMHQEIFDESRAIVRETEQVVAPSVADVADEHVDAALWFLVRSWMGRNGNTGMHQAHATMAKRFTSNGGSGGLRWASAVRSITAWHERLRDVQFLQMDCVELAERLEDSPRWAYHVDPPYIVKTKPYVHDFEEDDHARLALALRAKTQARVVVSYYDHEMLDYLYPGWTKVHTPVSKGLANAGSRKKGRTVAPEVLLINGPSLTAGALFGGSEGRRECR